AFGKVVPRSAVYYYQHPGTPGPLVSIQRTDLRPDLASPSTSPKVNGHIIARSAVGPCGPNGESPVAEGWGRSTALPVHRYSSEQSIKWIGGGDEVGRPAPPVLTGNPSLGLIDFPLLWNLGLYAFSSTAGAFGKVVPRSAVYYYQHPGTPGPLVSIQRTDLRPDLASPSTSPKVNGHIIARSAVGPCGPNGESP
ncbi:hypothetical protein WUBG_18780, partial [Wuchereria bancrofti]